MEKQQNDHRLLIASAILLGMGIAGLFDGIVLHKILQWHHMLSSVRPPTNGTNLDLNQLWDNFFLAGVYTVIGVGIVLLWLASQRSNILSSSKIFSGCLAIGWGCFNVIEGLINHEILGIHHVKSGPNELAWDLGFLAVNAVIIAIGWIALRAEVRDVKAS
ncbi:MAG: DUF2243 domain-containing protein [Aphanothece sp. CMT-3BRIN-NPC111]|jgi:uncharacterized membrane protein|nr:DUF2243 domain-containing protein [Aphanothece sp. CMT-3BRIN-NPC111]